MKTPSQLKTKACLGGNDAVSKDKDLLEGQGLLADGALWEIQDMSINSIHSIWKTHFQADQRWIRLQVKSNFWIPPKMRHDSVSD